MGGHIDQDQFSQEYFRILSEIFDTFHEMYLDPGTSLFETLQTITAAQASIPVGGQCASLAAQVKHVDFFLEVLEREIRTGQTGGEDWDEIWRTVKSVNAEEWDSIRNHLKETYDRVTDTLRDPSAWDTDRKLGNALAIAVHSAYHLGEIRQALCTIRKG